MIRRGFLLLLALLVLPLPAAAQNAVVWEQSTLNQVLKRGELRVGLEAGYMPFEMLNKKGDLIGFDIDLARLMAKYMGVKVRFVNTQWDGIIPALLTGKFDLLMGGMTVTPERNLQVNFANPYIVVGQSVVLNRKLEAKVKSHEQLNSPEYTIATKLGTTGDIAAHKYMPRAHIKQFESEADAATEVRNGRADAFVYDLPFNAVYVVQNPDKLVHLKEPFTYEPLAWAVRKGDPDFINWLNNFLMLSKGDGSYDALYRKWFESSVWLKNVN